jgi:small subunit ribosomal protein S1
MVNKHSNSLYKELNGGPPPLDESWWEAVLAEDEAQSASHPARSAAPAPSVHKPAAPAPHTEALGVDWEQAEFLFSNDQVCTMQVTGHNRGGLLVSGHGLQGFVPVSHLVDLTGNRAGIIPDDWAELYLGNHLKLKIIECDRERGRVVFSERAALAESGSRNQLLTHLQAGDYTSGLVTNITDFGVFVDLGGVEGLIHVSEISWGRVRHPSDVVSYGEQIQVYVISVDQERSRVALSLKRLYPNPWETAEVRYYPGLITEATITSIVPFGAFARLEEGLDGLIHISEVYQDEEHIPPDELFCEGQKVKVRVLHVDAMHQRLGLSTRLDQ